jgi:uncharacterized protein YndB with AHSA1/START domain
MIAFENAIEIAMPPADVFAYVSDLEHVPEWNWAIDETRKVTPGPVRVGSTYRQVRSAPRPVVEVLEVVGLDPGRSVAIAGSLGPFRARLAYELSASSTGTRLVNRVELYPPVPLGPLGGVVGQRIASEVARNLDRLRRTLERQVV